MDTRFVGCHGLVASARYGHRPQGRSLAKQLRVTGVVSDPITRNDTRFIACQ